MKAGDKVRTNALRAIKTGIMQWETAKVNIGKTYDETVEISIIRKLKDQYIDAAAQCNDGKHEELVAENTQLAKIMEEFLPASVSENDVYKMFIRVTTGDFAIEPIKKNMGNIIKLIKTHLPGADGKLISQVVMKNIQ